MKELRHELEGDVELGARALLGCLLVRGKMVSQIVETEAYTWDDPGCHAYKKYRMKNMAMYGPPGNAYIYFTYGNHWMLNVVADKDGIPGAVLIRAAKPLEGLDEFRQNRPGIVKDEDLLSGPGKLAKAYGIDNRLNGINLLDSQSDLRIIETDYQPEVGISPRIGIAVGKGEELMRRYIDVKLIRWATRHKLNSTVFHEMPTE